MLLELDNMQILIDSTHRSFLYKETIKVIGGRNFTLSITFNSTAGHAELFSCDNPATEYVCFINLDIDFDTIFQLNHYGCASEEFIRKLILPTRIATVARMRMLFKRKSKTVVTTIYSR
jgi:hypothetical protein